MNVCHSIDCGRQIAFLNFAAIFGPDREVFLYRGQKGGGLLLAAALRVPRDREEHIVMRRGRRWLRQRPGLPVVVIHVTRGFESHPSPPSSRVVPFPMG